MQLWRRHRQAQILITGDAYSADITAKANIFEEISIMMLGMTGRIEGNEMQIAYDDLFPILGDFKLFSGTGRNSPHSFSI